MVSLLLYGPYANESSQICNFSSRAAAIRKRSSPKSQIIFAFVFSWIGDLFVFLELIFFKLRRVCFFEFNCTRLRAAVDNGALRLSPLYYDRGQQVAHSGGLTRSPLYLIGDAASRCGLSRVGYIIPLDGRRPLNGHPPSSNYGNGYYNNWKTQYFLFACWLTL